MSPGQRRRARGPPGRHPSPSTPTSKEACSSVEEGWSSSPDKDFQTRRPNTLEEPEKQAQEEMHDGNAGTGHRVGRTNMDYMDHGMMRERLKEERKRKERLNNRLR